MSREYAIIWIVDENYGQIKICRRCKELLFDDEGEPEHKCRDIKLMEKIEKRIWELDSTLKHFLVGSG